jgi:hypothetical protein
MTNSIRLGWISDPCRPQLRHHEPHAVPSFRRRHSPPIRTPPTSATAADVAAKARQAAREGLRHRAEIASLGGAANGRVGRPPGPGRKRPKNEASLIDALAAVLKGKTMGAAEAMEAVQGAGYRSSSPNFKAMVNGTLIKKKYFRRVERGAVHGEVTASHLAGWPRSQALETSIDTPEVEADQKHGADRAGKRVAHPPPDSHDEHRR